MKSVNNPLYIISIVALIFFITNESLTYFFGLETAKTEAFKKDKQILNNLTSAQAKNVQILAEILAVDADVIQAYKDNNPELIMDSISPVWERVKEKKITYEIHFFKPPAESFVNFSNFKSIGKDVSDVRTDIEWITSSFESSSHALMCKTYAGYRATHPITDEKGNMLGGLSLGKKVDWIPQAIKEQTNHNAFLVYEKESTRSLAKKYYDNFLKDKELVGNYILADRTLDVGTSDIKGIDFSKDIQEITLKNKVYTLLTFPIIDFNKNIMGYVCTVTELEDFKDIFFKNLVKNFVIIVLSVLLVFIGTRRRITDLLKEIRCIRDMTHEIEERNFSSLRVSARKTDIHTASLVELKENVIGMGLELEKQYTTLEEQVQEKTDSLNVKNRQLESLISSINKNVIYSTVNLFGIITHASEAFSKISGYSIEELIGKNHIELCHPDMSHDILEKTWKSLQGEKTIDLEILSRTKSGEDYWVQAKFEPNYDEDGKHIGYSSTRFDITNSKKVKSLQEEIEETQREVIFRMGSIGESRSEETGFHVKRVAEYSKLLALYYGLSKEEAEMLKQASPMHDIGKIAIPDAILNKPGRLDKEERIVMDTHAKLG